MVGIKTPTAWNKDYKHLASLKYQWCPECHGPANRYGWKHKPIVRLVIGVGYSQNDCPLKNHARPPLGANTKCYRCGGKIVFQSKPGLLCGECWHMVSSPMY